jgi:hypothetical protein
MSCDDPLRTLTEEALERPHRAGARISVELTEREARSLIRATTLVTDVLRPELLAIAGRGSESPLITAYQVLLAACERAGVDLGMPLVPPPRA